MSRDKVCYHKLNHGFEGWGFFSEFMLQAGMDGDEDDEAVVGETEILSSCPIRADLRYADHRLHALLSSIRFQNVGVQISVLVHFR